MFHSKQTFGVETDYDNGHPVTSEILSNLWHATLLFFKARNSWIRVLICSWSLVTSAIYRDVAIQRPASQISTHPADAVAGNAVDGHATTFAQTERQDAPFWYVDLGESILVDHLQITPHDTQREYFQQIS